MKRSRPTGLLLVGLWLLAGVLYAWPADLKEGDLAPDFTLPDQDGVEHTLSDYQGQKVLVYFYPKDDTPGCTKEACGLRDAYTEYEASNIVILGISYDTAESHRQFREKHSLPFTLLSDTKKTVSAAYGTKGIYPLAIRRSFLIDEEGRIIKIIKDVDVTTHSQDVLKYFREAAPQP
ncbi:MAG: thioredoxin-dependent thiol peroxidase [Fidelibacterota bacterium]|nr:MAG: thioredoxin-dependent thiol peroxidase [Candidatus Neomarinimicrobiota bacterium]